MTLHEPATLATDYVLTALSAGCAWRLRRIAAPTTLPGRWWGRALAFTAAGSFAGGSWHGFQAGLPASVASLLWLTAMLLLGLTSAAMMLALVHELAPPAARTVWANIVWLKFSAFTAVALFHSEYIVVICDYGSAMLMLAACAALTRRRWRPWMLGAVGLSVLAALIQQLRWAPAPWFNHNDLYHLVQGLAIWLFFLGGQRLGSNPKIHPDSSC